MRTALVGTALVLVLVSGPALAQPFEDNQDRHGFDIVGADFWLPREGRPVDCHNACNSNFTCRAWTFLRPYYFANEPNPSCKLKYKVAEKTDDVGAVSGVKGRAFQYNCKDISIAGATLAANCLRVWDGRLISTSIMLGGLANDDGQLRFASGNRMSPGTFQNSCQDISVNGNRLTAHCRRNDGSYQQTTLVITPDIHVNFLGELEWNCFGCQLSPPPGHQ